MQSIATLFAVGFGLTSLFLWIYFFRMIRKNMGDPESRIRTAVKALLLLAVALSIQLVVRLIPRIDPYPWVDALIFMLCVVLWAFAGMVINYKVTHNYPHTPFQHKVNMFTTVVMVASFVWASVIYFGFVFLPAMGLSLEHSLIISAGTYCVFAVWEFVN